MSYLQRTYLRALLWVWAVFMWLGLFTSIGVYDEVTAYLALPAIGLTFALALTSDRLRGGGGRPD